ARRLPGSFRAGGGKLVLVPLAADDLRLRVVLDRPGLPTHFLTRVDVVQDPGVRRGEARDSFRRLALAVVQPPGVRLLNVGLRTGLRLDPVALGAPDLDRDAVRGPGRLDRDTGLRVVGERHVDAATAGRLEHRGLARDRVAADVVAVRLVPGVLQAGGVRRVVPRRGELGDAAADRPAGDAVLDDACLDVPLVRGPRAGVLVQAERLARLDDRPVDLLGDRPDVDAGVRREAT